MNWQVIKSNCNRLSATSLKMVCLPIIVGAVLCSLITPNNSCREQQWIGKIEAVIRDSICSKPLITKWPDPEWIEGHLFDDSEAKIFFTSDTITICVAYDYVFSSASITLYNGEYEKQINIGALFQTENDIENNHILHKPQFSDIKDYEPYFLLDYYLLNWDFDIPDFILDRGPGIILDDYVRYLVYRIIRHPDNTFSIQSYPIHTLIKK